MSRFPTITETFILFEMVALEEAGAVVELFPLLRERATIVHPEAEPFVRRGRFQPFVSASIVAANVRSLRRDPRRYVRTVVDVLRGVWGSPNFMVGALGIFPKTVRSAELMVELGVDHVHCHFANHPALAGFIVNRLTGLPFSFTAHGSDLHKDRHMLPQKVDAAAFVCAVSDHNRRLIVEECGGRFADRVHVVHCGVDTAVFSPATDGAPGEAPFAVTCIGTLHEVKGQVHLIDAVAALRRDGLDVPVELIGDGPDREKLEKRAADTGVADLVRFAGLLRRGEVAARVARTSAVVSPSVPTRAGKREGIPVVLMEAMAAGRPVVASRLSGIPELVEDEVSGLLTPPGDAEAIARALRRLAADPELRARLGDAARRKVQADFDVRRNAARVLELVRSARA